MANPSNKNDTTGSSFDPELPDTDTLPSSTCHRVEKWRVGARRTRGRLSTLTRTSFSRILAAIKRTLEAFRDIQPSPEQKSPFLTLPPEIRLLIYELLFEVDHPKSEADEWRVGNIGSNYVCMDDRLGHCHHIPSVNAGILKTCKRVYQEARPILYSRIAFYVGEPCYSIDSLWCRGGSLGYITTLQLSIDLEDKGDGSWLRILDSLRLGATSLRYLQVNFWLWAEVSKSELYPIHERLMKALADIRQVESLHVSGPYGIHMSWPEDWSTRWPKLIRRCVGEGPQIHVSFSKSEREWTCSLQRKQIRIRPDLMYLRRRRLQDGGYPLRSLPPP
ncbi:hypothetical protein FQN53_005303 [Emmonsiellopsis sp. PD_33]|nr:hypothetical protein FQN53_005303 [Emmonsiellopsis sp. PD_33]